MAIDGNSPIGEYEVIGSGFVIGRFLFKLTNRWLNIAHQKWTDILVRRAAQSCGYMINEIKESDLYTGGKTRVAYIDYEGIHELTKDDISKIPQDFVKSFIESISTIDQHQERLAEILTKSMSE